MSTSEMPAAPAPAPTPKPGHAADSTLWRRDASGWTGWIAFAAIMAITMGAYEAIMGLVALFNDEYYLVGKSGLTVQLDFTAWGWIHIIGGILVAGAGFALFTGQVWARAVGVAVAMISAFVNIGFLSAYPIWCTILIALDVIVIYALTVHWDDVRA